MKPVPPGARLTREIVPGEADTAAAIGNESIGAVSTAALVAHLEQTCHLLIAPYYEAGEATVGVRIEIDHLAPAVPGRALALTAELTSQHGRRLDFTLAAGQDGSETARGRHTRVSVRIEAFAARLSRVDVGEAPKG